MKTKIITLFMTLMCCVGYAQEGINYKALIKDTNGNVLANTSVDVQLTIRRSYATGTIAYQEDHTSVITDTNGIINLNIGEGTTTYNFSSINWGFNEHWLNVQIDIGDGLVDLGTTQFMAVPYAKYAENAGGGVNSLNDLNDAKSDNGADYSGSSLFLGRNAGYNDDGTNNRNSSVGFFTLNANTTGTGNVAIGNDVLRYNTTGSYNVANGFDALGQGIDGSSNTAIGSLSLRRNETGDSNVAIGANAGERNVSGNNNIYIGRGAGRSGVTNESNKLYINNEESNDPLIYGEFDTDLIRINGTLDVTEEINTAITGNSNMVPIAYGIVESTGNVLSGTGNFTAFLSGNVFIIDANGTESLSYSNTVCMVTPISTAPRTSSTVIADGNGDGDADLNVRIFNASGTQVTTTFQFIIYKL